MSGTTPVTQSFFDTAPLLMGACIIVIFIVLLLYTFWGKSFRKLTAIEFMVGLGGIGMVCLIAFALLLSLQNIQPDTATPEQRDALAFCHGNDWRIYKPCPEKYGNITSAIICQKGMDNITMIGSCDLKVIGV